jgi:hypothetical protein
MLPANPDRSRLARAPAHSLTAAAPLSDAFVQDYSGTHGPKHGCLQKKGKPNEGGPPTAAGPTTVTAVPTTTP